MSGPRSSAFEWLPQETPFEGMWKIGGGKFWPVFKENSENSRLVKNVDLLTSIWCCQGVPSEVGDDDIPKRTVTEDS